MKDPDFELIFLVLVASVALTDLFLYCYFAKLAAESYEKMSESLYNCNWPDLPNQLRRYFIIMIGNSQRPQCYAGFEFVVLNLDTFCSASIFEYFRNLIRITLKYHSEHSTFQTYGVLEEVFWSFSKFSDYFQMIRSTFTYYMMFKTLTHDWSMIMEHQYKLVEWGLSSSTCSPISEQNIHRWQLSGQKSLYFYFLSILLANFLGIFN